MSGSRWWRPASPPIAWRRSKSSPARTARPSEEGGEKFAYLPALNDSEDGMRVIEAVVRRELQGWVWTSSAMWVPVP